MKKESVEFWPRVFYQSSLLFYVISFFCLDVNVLHENSSLSLFLSVIV